MGLKWVLSFKSKVLQRNCLSVCVMITFEPFLGFWLSFLRFSVTSLRFWVTSVRFWWHFIYIDGSSTLKLTIENLGPFGGRQGDFILLTLVRKHSYLKYKLHAYEYKRSESIIHSNFVSPVPQAFFWVSYTVHTELLVIHCISLLIWMLRSILLISWYDYSPSTQIL